MFLFWLGCLGVLYANSFDYGLVTKLSKYDKEHTLHLSKNSLWIGQRGHSSLPANHLEVFDMHGEKRIGTARLNHVVQSIIPWGNDQVVAMGKNFNLPYKSILTNVAQRGTTLKRVKEKVYPTSLFFESIAKVNNTIYLFNVGTNSILKTLGFGNSPKRLSFKVSRPSPNVVVTDNRYMWVIERGTLDPMDYRISRVDTQTQQRDYLTPKMSESWQGNYFAKNDEVIFTAFYRSELIVFDKNTATITEKIPVGINPTGITSWNKCLYITDEMSRKLLVLNENYETVDLLDLDGLAPEFERPRNLVVNKNGRIFIRSLQPCDFCQVGETKSSVFYFEKPSITEACR